MLEYLDKYGFLFVLRFYGPNGAMSSTVSLPSQMFTGQA